MENLHRRSGGRHVIDAVYIMFNMKQYSHKAAIIPFYINMMETSQKNSDQAKLLISDDMLVAIATKDILASDRPPQATDAW